MSEIFANGRVRDVRAGLVVFLVALPLCLGVAMASNAPLFSGVMAGIIGGIIVGMVSRSRVSVSGPGPGLTAIVAAQIAALGSFEAFLTALVIAGLIQIVLGLARAGAFAAFFPSSVINGLLAAIGVILILKQIPHVFGHDPDPEGDMAFLQPDFENSFSELGKLAGNIHPGATLIGVVSIALLVLWDRWKVLKKSGLPAPLIVVLAGIGLSLAFRQFGGRWTIGSSHLVQVPMADSLTGFLQFLKQPDFSQLTKPAVFMAALTLAAVASLETLLNLNALDKLDPERRVSPPSRELLAQGIGNVVSGMMGGLPITSVIVRSSVNINAGAKSRLATIIHGLLLFVSVVFFPAWLNRIPLSCLAAILLVTGIKLASPALVRRMRAQGRYQFIPFALTVVSIVVTDLLTGILIGLATSIAFILNSNVRRPIRRVVEKHLGGEVVRIELANQVSFFNRAALIKAFDEVPRGGHLLLDARNTDYIDPDVLSLIRDFKEQSALPRGVDVSLLGFRSRYQLRDQTQYVDCSTREIQRTLRPRQVLEILKEGHQRFRSGRHLTRDTGRQVNATANGQHPLAVVLGCIDSRIPAELIFDLGVGDIFSVRIAGNITSRKVLGSVEYGCAVAGAKLILVMGHTRCGAVTGAVDLARSGENAAEASGCQHLGHIVRDIQRVIGPDLDRRLDYATDSEKEAYVNEVARRNVVRVVQTIRAQSRTLDLLAAERRILIVGAMYDVTSGEIEFLPVPEESLLETVT
jgi:carbonic anhydrase